MGSGLLTGAFDAERIARLDPDDWRRDSPLFSEPLLSRNLALVERLRPLAEQLGTTLPALAVAWTLAQSGVTAAIVGARLPRHVDGWLPGAELELGDLELRRDRRGDRGRPEPARTIHRPHRRTCGRRRARRDVHRARTTSRRCWAADSGDTGLKYTPDPSSPAAI